MTRRRRSPPRALRRPRRRPASAWRRLRRLAGLAFLVAVSGGGGGLAVAVHTGAMSPPAPSVPALSLPRVSLPEIALPDLGASLRDPRLRLHTVDFVGLHALSARQLLELSALRREVALIDVDPGAVCEKLEEHPRIAGCAAARLPPDRLIVEVAERVPVAVLAGSRIGIDAEGERFPLSRGEAGALPRIEGRADRALPLLRAAADAGVPLQLVDARTRGRLLFRPAGADVRVLAGGDLEQAIGGWRRVVQSGLVEQRSAREVDLRFRGCAVLRDFTDRGGR